MIIKRCSVLFAIVLLVTVSFVFAQDVDPSCRWADRDENCFVDGSGRDLVDFENCFSGSSSYSSCLWADQDGAEGITRGDLVFYANCVGKQVCEVPVIIEESCTDSDGDDPYTFNVANGRLEIFPDSPLVGYEDYCIDDPEYYTSNYREVSGQYVLEVICNGEYIGETVHECQNGCYEGACVQELQPIINSVLIAKSSDNMNLGDNWGIFTGTIDEDDLPNVLGDGTFTAADNDLYDYEQNIILGNPILTHFRDSDYEDLALLDDRTPTIGFKIPQFNIHILTYVHNFIQTVGTNIVGGRFDDFEGAHINLLGRDFYIVKATSSLLLSMISGKGKYDLEEAETKTFYIDGRAYVASIRYLDTDEVVLDINGERVPASGKMVTGGITRFDETNYISIIDVDKPDSAGERGSIYFVVGDGKLELSDGNDVKWNDDTITGLKANIETGSFTSPDQEGIDSISLEWNTDEEEFLTNDLNLHMPKPFDHVYFSMDDFVSDRDEEKITIEPDGDDSIRMIVPIKDGTVNFNLVYANQGSLVGLGESNDDRLATSASNEILYIEKSIDGSDYHSWFVASYANGGDGESYLLRAKVSQDNSGFRISENVTEIQKNVDGSWVEVCKKIAGETCDIGDVSFVVDSITYVSGGEESVVLIAGQNVAFNKLHTRNGLTIKLPLESDIVSNSDNFRLFFNEETKDDDLSLGNSFSVLIEANSEKLHVSKVDTTGILSGTGGEKGLEVGNSNTYESYVVSDVGTKILHHTGADEDYVEIYYPGPNSESYAEVYLNADKVNGGNSGPNFDYNVVVVFDVNAPINEVAEAIDIGQALGDEGVNNYIIKNTEIDSVINNEGLVLVYYHAGKSLVIYPDEYYDFTIDDFPEELNGYLESFLGIESVLLTDSDPTVEIYDLMSTWNLYFEDQNYINVELSEGWNLVPFRYLLTDPINNINNRDYKDFFIDNGIRAVFMYNVVDKSYAQLHALISNSYTINEIKEIIYDVAGYYGGDQLNVNNYETQNLLHTPFWAYSDSDQQVNFLVENEYFLSLEYTRLYSGWNFITIDSEFTGKSLNEWKGDCKVISAAIWSSEFQGWDFATPDDYDVQFTSNLEGEGMVIRVLEECTLGDNIMPPQLPIGETCEDTDGGINLVESGEICIDGVCFPGDYCDEYGRLTEWYCDDNEAKKIERWGNCRDGERVINIENNEHLIVENIGNMFISRVDSQENVCEQLREEQHEFPGYDFIYSCDAYFASYANLDNPYDETIAYVFEREAYFDILEVEELKDSLIEGYERLFNENNGDEGITIEVSTQQIGGDFVYVIVLTDGSNYLPFVAWFNTNKIIFIAGEDEYETGSIDHLDEILNAYLARYPSEISEFIDTGVVTG